MRISDWSSDVCSSDLAISVDDEPPIDKAVGPFLLQRKRAQMHPQPMACRRLPNGGEHRVIGLRYRLFPDAGGLAVQHSAHLGGHGPIRTLDRQSPRLNSSH